MSRATNYLKRWIRKENAFGAIFKHEPIELPVNKEECKPLFDSLLCKLSPENLSCDGELAPSKVAALKKQLDWAWQGLEEIYGESVSEEQVWKWWDERKAS